MSDPETTGTQRADIATRFKPGNPGRPKGSKNKLCENFYADMLAAWQDKGKAAIEQMIEEKPGDFVKTVATLVPKEIEASEELATTLTEILARIDGRTRTIATEQRETLQ